MARISPKSPMPNRLSCSDLVMKKWALTKRHIQNSKVDAEISRFPRLVFFLIRAPNPLKVEAEISFLSGQYGFG